MHLFVVFILLMTACDSAPVPSNQEPAVVRVELGLPGAEPEPASVKVKIDEERKRLLDNGLATRTRHLREDGTPRFTNRLILESSPYLQQHAFNPVDWHPWGEEAFEKAARLNRPVLLSIGYSTCHWCHVMEHESFEDPEIAEFLNRNYVAIKVDREERPDIDEIYMAAVRALTGAGGWPMTVWLTPERAPFMGGTYFPARAGDRGSTKGFLDLLQELSNQFTQDPTGVAAKAQALTTRLVERMESPLTADLRDPEQTLRTAKLQFERGYDATHGGWGQGNKFPMPSRLRFLMRYQRRGPDSGAVMNMLTKTLDEMMAGGIYDHVGGGFHRYTVDRTWTVPHFEKMLYDNAQLILVYTDAWLITKKPAYKRVVEETIAYLLRDMQDSSGAFWAASDAQGEGEEGLYYTWTEAEAGEVLQPEELAFAKSEWGLGTDNFHGRTVLRMSAGPNVVPKAANNAVRNQARQKLLQTRQERKAPHIDKKLIAAWNGLALEALARAAFVFDRPDWTQASVKLGKALLKVFRGDAGTLVRSVSMGKPSGAAFSGDYAMIISGLLELFQLTADRDWMSAAVGLQAVLDSQFWDEEEGGYFRTGHEQGKDLLANERPSSDGAIPSANSYAAYTLVRLHRMTLSPIHQQRLKALFRAFGQSLNRGGGSMPMMLAALDFETDLAKEVAVVEGADGPTLVDVLRSGFFPNVVFLNLPEAEVDRMSSVVKWVKGKKARNGRTTAYVCRDTVCELPTADPAVFQEQLGQTRRY